MATPTGPKVTDEEAGSSQPSPEPAASISQPLLSPSQPASPTSSSADEEETAMLQKAISQTFQSTADLAKRLPTGTVLAFQLLSPLFTEVGQCSDADRILTMWLLGVCALSSFILSFTDSFKDDTGKLRYGFATTKGLYVIDGGPQPAPEQVASYHLTVLDYIHALTSLLVFAAVALFDKNVVSCFYPSPSRNLQQVLAVLPIGIGVLGSMLFIVFPTKRNGVGFPVSTSS